MTNDLIDAIADDDVCQRCGEDIVNPEDVYDTGMDLYHDWCVNDEDDEDEDDDY